MKVNGKSFTIHTELIDGTLDGARDVYLGANSTCHLYVIPREEINLANAIEDIAGQPAFYILIDDLNAKRPQAYIGHTTDFSNRKNDHVQKKDFWNTALVFISDNHKIYGDDVKFLEYLGIKSASEVESCDLLNGNNPKRPNIAPFRVNDMEVFFRDILLLARFCGCKIFDLPQKEIENTAKQLFFIHGAEDRPCEAKARYDETAKQLIVLKGSTMATKVVSSYANVESRNKFIAEHCEVTSHQITLKEDCAFSSPSGASSMFLGRPSNGWVDWKDADGKPLGESVER